ncbi:hypothetical protein OPIT5_26880 [Opitutaceae bacterium TAV5]|nr:hypothetical protein OPIT5_26880 [Opitutaceae bacterium TAV5]
MKTQKMNPRLAIGTLMMSLIAFFPTLGSAADLPAPVLDFSAANYTAAKNVDGLWIDSSASHNNATPVSSGSISPALKSDATPLGLPAVNFNYNAYQDAESLGFPKSLKLTTPLTGPAFTTAPTFTLTFLANISDFSGGPAVLFTTDVQGGLTYRINVDGTQTLTRASTADIGTSSNTSVYTPGTWSVFTVTFDSTSGACVFYMDGTVVGTSTPNIGNRTFATPTNTQIGGGFGSTKFFGEIAALKVYDTALTTDQVLADYNSLRAAWLVAPVPEPATCALLLGGVTVLAAFAGRNRRRKHDPRQ